MIFEIKEPLKNHYEGFVFNEEKMPLAGVKVIENKSDADYVLTDKRGFFKLDKTQEIDDEDSLIFIKKGYEDKHIIIIVLDYHPLQYHFLFLRSQSDTLIMEKTKNQKTLMIIR